MAAVCVFGSPGQLVEPDKRSPSWINRSVMHMARVIKQANPTLWTEPWAIFLTDRLERQ